MKVGDLGLTVLHTEGKMRTGNVGTDRFQAPEVRGEQRRVYDEKADIWSIAATACDMLSPFESPSVEILDTLLPEGISSVLKRCLDDDPDARPTACELSDHLLSHQCEGMDYSSLVFIE